MKASRWGGAAVAILILLGAAAYGEETVPPDQASNADLIIVNRKSAETLYEMKKKRLQATEEKRAEVEAKQRKQEKQARVDKFQRKTGRTPTSWQVLNR